MCILEKIFFYNISPIIGSSNHKGIVFLFFVFVSLDENQSSQYSFSRKEEVCFHIFFCSLKFFSWKFLYFSGHFFHVCMYFRWKYFFNVSSPIIATNLLFFLSTTKSTFSIRRSLMNHDCPCCLLDFPAWFDLETDRQKSLHFLGPKRFWQWFGKLVRR